MVVSRVMTICMGNQTVTSEIRKRARKIIEFEQKAREMISKFHEFSS